MIDLHGTLVPDELADELARFAIAGRGKVLRVDGARMSGALEQVIGELRARARARRAVVNSTAAVVESTGPGEVGRIVPPMSVTEYAERTGRKPQAIYRSVARGTLAAERVDGRLVIYPEEDTWD